MLVETPAHTVGEDASLTGVARTLVEDNVTAVAVIDGAAALCGLITAPDLLAARADWTAVDAMSSAHAVSANTSIEAVADVMARERYEHVVVTDDAGQVVGVVTARDVARHCCGY